MSELHTGQQIARAWLEQELAAHGASDATTPEAVVDLAAAIGQVEDAFTDDLTPVQDLLARGRAALSGLAPASVLSDLPSRDLAGELADTVLSADPTEVCDWLLAADELARAARVLGLAEQAAPPFAALAQHIADCSSVYAPFADFAERQEDRGLGARMERPLLRFWTQLAMADLRADILLEHLPDADEDAVQRGLAALHQTAAPPGAVVIDLSAFRARRPRHDKRLHLAADDSSTEITAVPAMERLGGGPGWEAFLQFADDGEMVAIYGLTQDAAPHLTGPDGEATPTWSDERWTAPVHAAGDWVLDIGDHTLRFRLTEGS